MDTLAPGFFRQPAPRHTSSQSEVVQARKVPVDYLLLKPLWNELREVPPEYSRIVVRTARRIARDFKRVAGSRERLRRASR